MCDFHTGMTWRFHTGMSLFFVPSPTRRRHLGLVDENYACATRSSLPRDRFIPKRVAVPCLHDTGTSFRFRKKSRPGTATGMNSFRYESYRYETLDRYHVNEYRATRGKRDELIPL